MAELIVPAIADDEEKWPTLGPQLCDFYQEKCVYGPGSFKGMPYVVDDEFRWAVYRAYQIYPRNHPWAGQRRFKRVGISWRKGLAKTERMAIIAYGELHPDAPVRFDGWDANGDPVGRPVAGPYIPLLSYNLEQTEELVYSALEVIVSEGEDAALFDVTKERIIRLDQWGREDGKAIGLSTSPNARDGARTTFQGFDEPHRLYLPRMKQAHEVMDNNLPKRPLEQPWALYVGTAGRPGQKSIAEDLYNEAKKIASGRIKEPRLFYIHRDSGPIARSKEDLGHDLSTMEGRIAAIKEASGPYPEFGPGQFRDIAERWDRHGADLNYLERVWLNRWTAAAAQAFDPLKVDLTSEHHLFTAGLIKPGSFVTAGFDGARFKDSTAIVITEIETGKQQLWDLWEKPVYQDDWEIDEAKVRQSVAEMMRQYDVWRFNCDPPHWTESVAGWASLWECVEEWWTNRYKTQAQANRAYREAMNQGEVSYALDLRVAANSPNPESMAEAFGRHLAAAGKDEMNIVDEDGTPLFLLCKIERDRVFDVAMAAVLSWAARLDALRKNAQPRRRSTVIGRIR